ncbi:MAG: bifunctional glutamate N-acetyltransferase/amino-acid acetyltransferase ArgJ [Candidatus Thiodiazotropha endolucinida]|uniref:Arginine biosynthesis bifunctional protein ArgJ n=1 Tax=Candidatus Thiodiazotropha endolucinida TaxID=1655433 RepID=A0A7Z0VNK5_9GAMM|nr:bifunctional glutamate N-acetyltransferase/amino-acid acetyltransferase ArgJ [Candidatus Thiodiazotropha endolucinida]MBT3012736.1 bifunctional glutamate N-acetyltransferase/amino-acid acetyltransferase ArgJ [Candidatus Thiodiazotropha sp. (ex Lucina pensylvanica)]MBT3039626.1 bifunctional glutamate N-acetyltransferase/amino-acid acetyltransferase ArgJ [Candidatus Thiodiazotropha sp. (ex Codakia orbicularis)]MBV2125998.1 bifunctional glutamate N-acetyltransferase/amino-acid acetyltransferase 
MNATQFAIPGIRLGTAAAGIKYPDRDDMVVIEVVEGASCAAVFTRNAFCAAPVQLAKKHLALRPPRYLLINSGNANAGTGDQGMQDAHACCRVLAETVACQPDQVLPFSTGVIGESLPVERIHDALPAAIDNLSTGSWETASRAILTTDTRPKLRSRHFEFEGVQVRLTGMAKGSGMICPDMATMLAYLATDLSISQALLQACLDDAVKPSFNSITVDGDTSTNDACVLMASGASTLAPLTERGSDLYKKFVDEVTELCMELARDIVRDGEGATKLVEILVQDAADEKEARRVAYTIAHSPLVKTALFASDPNWGRILAAVGRAGLAGFDIDRVEIWLDDTCIVRNGGRAAEYTEQAGASVMSRDEFTIRVMLGRGDMLARVATCDLSYDYVKINAEYRT